MGTEQVQSDEKCTKIEKLEVEPFLPGRKKEGLSIVLKQVSICQINYINVC